MRFKFTLFLFFVVFNGLIAQMESPISGIINLYAAVSEVDDCSNSVVVDESAGFQVGDQVILIQMQGAAVDPGDNSNDSNFGIIEDMGAAGFYEKNRIASINGNRIFLEKILVHTYDVQSSIQLVSMPVYENAITTDTVKAMPWDGTKGGIVAFEVLGELKVDAPISVAGLGFRGGQAVAVQPNDCSFTNPQRSYYFTENNWRGAPKGESISKFITGREWGRGSQANGGGGGNDHNSGGGGGANVTAGGLGGRNNVSGLFLCNGNNPGFGGNALLEEEARVYFGGGGGAGHTNNTLPGAGGGRGGGIIMIKAPIITRIFGGIYADGQSVAAAEGDGAGGGGGGGTILLEADSLSENILVHSFGGNGGTVNNIGDPTRCFGPGGGGAGGRILLTKMVSLPNTSFQIAGGLAGRSINSDICPEDANGTGPGENGVVSFFSGLVENPDTLAVPDILNQPTLVQACVGNPVLLEVETQGSNLSFQWQINRGAGFENLSNDATFSGTQTAILSITEASADVLNASFRLQIDNGCGGQLTSETIQLEEGQLPNVNFNISVNQLMLTVNSITPSNALEYFWDFGDGNTSDQPTPTHTYTQNGSYEVKVRVRNACGVDSLTQIVPIRGAAGPTAAFSYADTTGCNPVTVRFMNESSSDAVSFQWSFMGGSPAASMEENPVVSYAMAGNYQARLIVADINGVADTFIHSINVVITPKPIADFEFIASGLDVSFDNLSLNADNFIWDFGDGGATSTETEPSHTFPETGVYDVQLIASNPCGSDTLTAMVQVEAPPGANFVVDKTEGCDPVMVTFRNTSVGDYDRLAWSFQNGTPDFSTEENPVVTYTESGSFEVILVVFNEGGSTTASQMIDIQIADPPIADFSLDANELRINIQDNAQNADSLCWLVERDTGLVEQIIGPLSQYVFDSPGTYQFSQIAKNRCGADTLTQMVSVNSNPVADFEFDTNAGCGPLSINIRNTSEFADSYEWIFEGGIPASSTDPEPSVTYTESGRYEWTLIAINAAGRDTMEETVEIEVFELPVADFEEGDDGFLTLNLKSLANRADSICWIIEGELFPAIATDSFFNYTFMSPGTYSFGMIAKNECGTDTLFSEIFINGIPDAEFFVKLDSGCAPLTLEITSPYFVPPFSDQFETKLEIWEGPDLNRLIETIQQPVGTILYETSEEFLVFKLEVPGPFGFGTSVEVVELNIDPAPTANFTFNNDDGLTINFNNLSSNGDSFLWDFGDGNTSTLRNPDHTYVDAADYDVSLIAFNECGSDTTIQNVSVSLAPLAAFDIVIDGECAPIQILLIDQSSGSNKTVTYEFSGPPVVEVGEIDGLYRVQSGGDLSITMIVENDIGSDVLTQTISLGTRPQANFSTQKNDLTFNFQDQSSNANQVRWAFGDGSTSQERNPTHQYAAEGQYTVQMIVSNDCGSDTLSRQVTAGEVLSAKFIAINSFGCAPHLVQFRDRSTGNVASMEWSFPGGMPATSTEAEPRILYTQVGTYPVTLTVSGPLGTNTTTIEEMIEIVTFPSADFSYEIDGFQVRFTNRSENAEGYRWDFGDGTTSEEENPVHTFSRGGVFSVTLNATIATCGSSVTMNIPVMLSDAEDVFTSEDLKVYPNPARDRLFIESWLPTVFPLTFELISTHGQLLISRQLSRPEQIDLQAFPNGLYYIRMSNEEKQWVGKLLKME